MVGLIQVKYIEALTAKEEQAKKRRSGRMASLDALYARRKERIDRDYFDAMRRAHDEFLSHVEPKP